MSVGTIVSRSSSACSITASATQTALEPFFLAIAMVTAGRDGDRSASASLEGAGSPSVELGKHFDLGKASRRPPAVPHVVGDFFGSVLHAGDVFEKHGPAVEDAHHQVAPVARRS